MRHTFGYFKERDLEGLSPTELDHWALIDRIMLPLSTWRAE